MAEIAIKQTLNDKSFRRGMSESAVNIRNWGKEAQKVFDSTRTPMERYAQDLAKLQKLHKDGYIAADTYARSVEKLAGGFGKIAIPKPAQLAKQNIPGAAANVPGTGMELGGLAQQIGGLGGGVGSSIASMFVNPLTGAIAAVGALGAAALRTGAFLGAMTDAAEKVGVSVGVFAKMEAMAIKSGVGVNELAGGMTRMERNVAEAAIKGGDVADALHQIGLSASDLAAMRPEESLEAIARGVMGIENKFLRTSVEMRLFGKAGAELEVMLRNLSEGGMDRFAELAPDETAIKAWDAFDDSVESSGMKLKKFFVDSTGQAIAGASVIKAAIMSIFTGEDMATAVGGTMSMFSGAQPTEDADRAKFALRAAQIEEIMRQADAAMPKGQQAPWEKISDLIARLEKLGGTRAEDAIAELTKRRAAMWAAEERKQREADEKIARQEREAEQRRAESALSTWQERMTRVRGDADETAAALIAGSKEFAGNLDKARAYIKEVKGAEATDKMVRDAETFEKSMRREFSAREGETSREAQLRDLVGRGLNERTARRMAGDVARLDAEDIVGRGGRRDRLAPNMARGSQSAYDAMAIAKSQAAAPDKAERLAAETNRRLDRMNDWLGKIYNKGAQPAAVP